MILIPNEVNFILDTLTRQGHEAFVVGGCVRDCIMRHTPKDWDVTTSASPAAVKACFSNTHDTGLKHGTVTVVLGKKNYEITTYRVEGEYKDFRRPDKVSFTTSVEEDLQRRDFTMNAIAYHPDKGFIDPYGGIADIKRRLIRAVGEASIRFNEDALRMMRAVRFSAQLGFEIEKETLEAVYSNAQLIKNISKERVRDELSKTLCSNNPGKVALFVESGIFAHALLGISVVNAESLECAENKLNIRYAVLLSWLSVQNADEIMHQLKFDNKTIKSVGVLCRWKNHILEEDFYAVRKVLSAIGAEAFEDLVHLKQALKQTDATQGVVRICSEIISSGDCLSLSRLAVCGQDLLALGITGKKVGQTLNALLEAVLENPFKNTKAHLIKMAENFIFSSEQS